MIMKETHSHLKEVTIASFTKDHPLSTQISPVCLWFLRLALLLLSIGICLDAVIRTRSNQELTDSIANSTTTSSSARRPREVKAIMSSDPTKGIGLIIHTTINPKKTYDPGGIITHGEEIMEPRRSNKAYELILAQVDTKIKTSSSAHHQHATKKSHPQKMTQEEDTEKELTICSITTSSGSSIGTSSADLPYMEAFTFGRSIQHQTFTYQNYSVLSSFPSSLDVPSCTRPHKILHNFNKSYLPFLEKKEIKHQRLLSKNASCELFVNQVVPRILTYPLKPSRYKESNKSLDPYHFQPNG